MSNGLRVIGLAAALLATAFSSAARADGPKSVSDYYDRMIAAAVRVDAVVLERQRAADAATAQRLALTASAIRETASEFRAVEQATMLDPVADLPAPLPARADAALARAVSAETDAGAAPAFFAPALADFDALLDALPQPTPHSVLFGLLSRDLADPSEALPADIVVYGWRIVDPFEQVVPTVLYANKELPVGAVKVEGGRIEVRLPDDVKDAVHFAPSPCDSRLGFGLRVQTVYSQPHGIWPIRWRTLVRHNQDFYAMPTPIVYVASVRPSFASRSESATTVPFAERSSFTTADCGQTAKTAVAAPLPEGVTDVQCSAAWVDAAGAAKTNGRCRVEGHVAHAEGELSGGAPVCSPEKLCFCATPAQGWLEARGTYRLMRVENRVTAAEPTSISFPAGGAASARLETAGDVRNIAVTFTRRDCPATVDTLDLAIGESRAAAGVGVSRTGAFRAAIEGSTVRVGAASAFSADARGNP